MVIFIRELGLILILILFLIIFPASPGTADRHCASFPFRQQLLVEVDIVLPEDMNLHESHDIGESLQLKIEQLDEVERAFVHLDYECDTTRSLSIKWCSSARFQRRAGQRRFIVLCYIIIVSVNL